MRVAATRLKLTAHIEELEIQEEEIKDFHHKYPNVTVVIAKLESIHPKL